MRSGTEDAERSDPEGTVDAERSGTEDTERSGTDCVIGLSVLPSGNGDDLLTGLFNMSVNRSCVALSMPGPVGGPSVRTGAGCIPADARSARGAVGSEGGAPGAVWFSTGVTEPGLAIDAAGGTGAVGVFGLTGPVGTQFRSASVNGLTGLSGTCPSTKDVSIDSLGLPPSGAGVESSVGPPASVPRGPASNAGASNLGAGSSIRFGVPLELSICDCPGWVVPPFVVVLCWIPDCPLGWVTTGSPDRGPPPVVLGCWPGWVVVGPP